MTPIYIHTDLVSWAKGQVRNGIAPSVEGLVAESVLARKRDSEWLDRTIKTALDGVAVEGWINGDTVMRALDQWIAELDAKIEDFEAFLQERERNE
jgi:hypothetical protein